MMVSIRLRSKQCRQRAHVRIKGAGHQLHHVEAVARISFLPFDGDAIGDVPVEVSLRVVVHCVVERPAPVTMLFDIGQVHAPPTLIAPQRTHVTPR